GPSVAVPGQDPRAGRVQPAAVRIRRVEPVHGRRDRERPLHRPGGRLQRQHGRRERLRRRPTAAAGRCPLDVGGADDRRLLRLRPVPLRPLPVPEDLHGGARVQHVAVRGGPGSLLAVEGQLKDHHYWGDRYWDQYFLVLYRERWEEIADSFRGV